MSEKRVDPDDGAAYTYDEMAAYYKGKYKKKAIEAYWEECTPVKSKKGKAKEKAKAKGKEKAKAKPKAKEKAKVKAKAKAPKKVRVVKVGDKFPKVELHDGFPPAGGVKVAMEEYLKDKKVPGYLEAASKLKAKGIDEVIVYCVNDGATMAGWAREQKTAGTMVKMFADPKSILTKRLGMALRHPGPMSVLGNPRCKRFALVVFDGIVKAVMVSEEEGDPAGDNDAKGPVAAKTMAPALLECLDSLE